METCDTSERITLVIRANCGGSLNRDHHQVQFSHGQTGARKTPNTLPPSPKQEINMSTLWGEPSIRTTPPNMRHWACHSLVAATGYSDLHFPYWTADSSFLINDLISSPLPIVVARYFFTLLVPSLSFLLLPSPSGTFCSRSLYVPLPSGSFCMLLTCSS